MSPKRYDSMGIVAPRFVLLLCVVRAGEQGYQNIQGLANPFLKVFLKRQGYEAVSVKR